LIPENAIISRLVNLKKTENLEMINNTPLGLKDIKIVDFKENNGKLEVFLEKETTQASCPNCHTLSTSIRDYRDYGIIDKPLESGSSFGSSIEAYQFIFQRAKKFSSTLASKMSKSQYSKKFDHKIHSYLPEVIST